MPMHNIGAVMADALLKDTPSGIWGEAQPTNDLVHI